jgi:ABC-type glycerol-3-phosphate transport system substrate-binding protein
LPQAQAQALAEDVKAFAAKNPYYQVNLKHYQNPTDFMTPLLAGELEFDLVLAPPVLLGSLWAANQLVPMSDFFSANFMDNFAAVTLQGASQDGRVWGLPDTAGFHLLLFYNRDLINSPPITTEALIKLAQYQGQNPRPILGLNSYDPLWLTPWLAASGGWLTNEKGQPTLNTPVMTDTLKLYLDWHNPAAGLAAPATYDEVRVRFLSGDLPLVIDGEWAIGELGRAGQLNWGIAPLPRLAREGQEQPAAPLVLARYWAVNRAVSGDRALATAALLDYLTRPERQLAQTTRFGLLPTRRQALDDPAISNDPILRVNAAQMLAGRMLPLGVNPDALLNALREPLRQMLAGQLTPAEAAEAMQRNAE